VLGRFCGVSGIWGRGGVWEVGVRGGEGRGGEVGREGGGGEGGGFALWVLEARSVRNKGAVRALLLQRRTTGRRFAALQYVHATSIHLNVHNSRHKYQTLTTAFFDCLL